MRIMLDTNVLLSITVFRSKRLSSMLSCICEEHKLVLSTYVITECYDVVRRKNPTLVSALDRFFETLPFEIEHSPEIMPMHNLFKIRDADDEMVLYSAITADVDILITGDKDFFDFDIEKPEIMTPQQFTERHMRF